MTIARDAPRLLSLRKERAIEGRAEEAREVLMASMLSSLGRRSLVFCFGLVCAWSCACFLCLFRGSSQAFLIPSYLRRYIVFHHNNRAQGRVVAFHNPQMSRVGVYSMYLHICTGFSEEFLCPICRQVFCSIKRALLIYLTSEAFKKKKL